MSIEKHRAQHEAVTNVARKGGEPESSSEQIRGRALLRYLGAEFKRVTRRTPPAGKSPRSGS